jgi:hypothetical protein
MVGEMQNPADPIPPQRYHLRILFFQNYIICQILPLQLFLKAFQKKYPLAD